ncbi:hypothetical protein LCGC14_1337350 [marine sediment metagenome]|uniref:Uncharacterized protein n=1 Tax=marine sediment metagenome TaxID=412755 RepID=A0A0F9MVJ4_9ZZZZ
MTITEEMAVKALRRFRKEQKQRTRGTYTGCYCNGCVECMKLALEEVLKET